MFNKHIVKVIIVKEMQVKARANVAMWLDLDHMTRGEHIQEI
jgi:hypothetical protein